MVQATMPGYSAFCVCLRSVLFSNPWSILCFRTFGNSAPLNTHFFPAQCDLLGLARLNAMLTNMALFLQHQTLFIRRSSTTSTSSRIETIELFLNKREPSSKAQHRHQWHHPQSQLCD